MWPLLLGIIVATFVLVAILSLYRLPAGWGPLGARWQTVAAEASGIPEKADPVLRQKTDWGPGLQAFLAKLGENDAWHRAWARDGSWFNYPLVIDGKPVPGRAAELCPVTCSLLAGVKGVKLAGFSMVKAGGRIQRHKDGAMGCRALHLCLTGRSVMRVGKRRYVQEPGRVILFNPEEEHEVHNPGRQDRTLLFLNFTSP